MFVCQNHSKRTRGRKISYWHLVWIDVPNASQHSSWKMLNIIISHLHLFWSAKCGKRLLLLWSAFHKSPLDVASIPISTPIIEPNWNSVNQNWSKQTSSIRHAIAQFLSRVVACTCSHRCAFNIRILMLQLSVLYTSHQIMHSARNYFRISHSVIWCVSLATLPSPIHIYSHHL